MKAPTASRATRILLGTPRLEERIMDDPASLLGGGPSGLESAAGAAAAPAMTPAEEERRKYIEIGRAALPKIKKDREKAQLTPAESLGLEAIILLTGRPALLVQNGKFAAPPSEWTILEAKRQEIEANIPSVGRIEVNGHPRLPWIGTGFLVAEDVLMTNRHVANEFARLQKGKWTFQPGMSVRIDYREEFGSPNAAEFKITEILGIHQDVDMALVRVSRKGPRGVKAPPALRVAKEPKLGAKRQVYVVGYPASDSRNEEEAMRRIFSDIFNVKRMQPGEIMALQNTQLTLTHDCSTLGGNSGSCVIDLETGNVIGLHFGGVFRAQNFAVNLSKMLADPLVKKAKLNLV